MPKRLPRSPLHPGEILREQFMADFGVSINRLARDLRVPPTRIGEIVNERRSVTPDTALRLARYFGTTAEFWMNLQSTYDLHVARASPSRIETDVQPIAAEAGLKSRAG
jgi:addiction module HigA family antidote